MGTEKWNSVITYNILNFFVSFVAIILFCEHGVEWNAGASASFHLNVLISNNVHNDRFIEANAGQEIVEVVYQSY